MNSEQQKEINLLKRIIWSLVVDIEDYQKEDLLSLLTPNFFRHVNDANRILGRTVDDCGTETFDPIDDWRD